MERIKIFLIFLLFFLIPVFIKAQNPSKILISEVYFNPDRFHGATGTNEWKNEWIELRNLDDKEIDISGWKISDNYRTITIPNSPPIPPGGFVIITPTTSTFDFWPEIPTNTIKIVLNEKIGNGLNNEHDFIILKNQNGEIVDSVCWSKDEKDCTSKGFNYFCSNIPEVYEGYSLEKSPFALIQNAWFCNFFHQAKPNPGKEALNFYWHKKINDQEDSRRRGYEILSAQIVKGEDEILNFLPSYIYGHLCQTLIAKLELKEILDKEEYNFIEKELEEEGEKWSEEILGYGGIGMKIETQNGNYLLAFDLSGSFEFPQFLFFSEDGKNWHLLSTSSEDYFVYRFENNIFFALNMEKFSSLPWKLSFLSGFVYENLSEYQIFDETEEILIKGENHPPIPIINFSPKNPVKGVKVKFDALSSTDPDAEIKEFFWEIKKGEKILATSTATTTTFVFPENGEYQITLIATDNDGATSSTSTTIKVEPFSFAIITDLHIGRHYQEEYEGQDYYLTERLKRVVKWINENKDNVKCEENATCSIKFLAVLGDITENTPLSGFCKAKEILDQLQIPYVPVFGNHDVGTDKEFEQYSKWKGQDYFDEVFWSFNPPCQNATSTKNFELLLNELNFQRDKTNPDYKNFSISFGGINFIGLDFVSRKHFSLGFSFGYGVGSDAVLNETTKKWLEKKLEEFKGEPVILLTHHPLIFDLINAFSFTEFPQLENLLKDNITVFFDFAGHIHSFEEFWGKWPENANIKYPTKIHPYTPGNLPVITTEALMVGSNGRGVLTSTLENGVVEDKKGIVRIVKIFEKYNIDPYNWETTETGDEFLAFNPSIKEIEYERTCSPGKVCMEFESNFFTKKPFMGCWKVGNSNVGCGKEIILSSQDQTIQCSGSQEELKCSFSQFPLKTEVTLFAFSTATSFFEEISKKFEVKEGIFPKIIKVAKEKIEEFVFKSLTTGRNLLEKGRSFKDKVIGLVKHSLEIPVAIFEIDFKKAKGDIDFSGLIMDSDPVKKKAVLYMENWPNEVERSKILLLPK
jgi:PKD repeat protein